MAIGNRRSRNNKGQAVALPMVLVALMVALVIGLMAFELARTTVARDQLRTATEAAALAGAATLAGSSTLDINTAQSNALSAAKQVFESNDIIGQQLNNVIVNDAIPKAGQATLKFQFVDPSNNSAPVPQGDPKGKALQVSSTYGIPSLTGKIIGLGDAPVLINAQSSGGVGDLDVVLCFDCSGSMRFNTMITKIRRTWNENAAKIDYVNLGSSNQFNLAGGMLPEFINGGLNSALRGATDNSLPGNFPPGTAQNNGVTDLVVNLDESTNFQGFTEGNFRFPNTAALVEASRGNLESEAVFNSSGASTTLSGIVSPASGYQAKYFELARKHTHPFFEAVTAASNFFNLMNQNTNAHFGFVAFKEVVGQTELDGFVAPKVGQAYPAGGTGRFALPAISLNSDQATTNLDKVTNAVASIVPGGETNIGAALDKAVQMFSSGSRPNAKKAIILFTDGVPTVGLPLDPNPVNNSQKAAQECRDKGIAVFAVGLALNPSEFQQQNQVLSMITNTAGNGGKFFQVTDPSKLNAAYASIARNLTSVIQ